MSNDDDKYNNNKNNTAVTELTTIRRNGTVFFSPERHDKLPCVANYLQTRVFCLLASARTRRRLDGRKQKTTHDHQDNDGRPSSWRTANRGRTTTIITVRQHLFVDTDGLTFAMASSGAIAKAQRQTTRRYVCARLRVCVVRTGQPQWCVRGQDDDTSSRASIRLRRREKWETRAPMRRVDARKRASGAGLGGDGARVRYDNDKLNRRWRLNSAVRTARVVRRRRMGKSDDVARATIRLRTHLRDGRTTT